MRKRGALHVLALASPWSLPISNPCHLLVASLLSTLFIPSIQLKTYLAVTTAIVSYLFITFHTCFCSLCQLFQSHFLSLT